ncbi:MAG: hypothetical protein D8M58_16360 [Calditrichaeota bacterium]|nr:MAG: hypothetical protein DWQ03_08090 [Calditrichota bacterium]MBL1206980.1 hypothetical protein [Calditrichota bacterium]
MDSEFLRMSLAAFLALEAILFTVFGIMYSVFVKSADLIENGFPPLSRYAKGLCFRIILLICFNLFFVFISLLLELGALQINHIYFDYKYVLGLGLLVSSTGIAYIGIKIYKGISGGN